LVGNPGGACVDYGHDAALCGSSSVKDVCAPMELCYLAGLNGKCISSSECMMTGLKACNGGCYADLLSNAQNCGACGVVCSVAQVCVEGACVDFTLPSAPASGCQESPCSSTSTCCVYPGPSVVDNSPDWSLDIICVQGANCPKYEP
jgi:hypothetical protein